MLKRWLVVGLMLLLVTLLVVGCGIPQEEYDAVVAERDTAQTQVASVQSKLDKAQSQIENLESELAEEESQIETLQSEVEEAQSEIEALNKKIAYAKVLAKIVESIWVPAMTGELDLMSEDESMWLFLKWNYDISNSGDTILQEKYGAFINANFAYDKLLDLLIYIFETVPQILD